MPTAAEDRAARMRAACWELMKCDRCAGDMVIGRDGLVCEGGCGKIIDCGVGLNDLRAAFPERDLVRGMPRERIPAKPAPSQQSLF